MEERRRLWRRPLALSTRGPGWARAAELPAHALSLSESLPPRSHYPIARSNPARQRSRTAHCRLERATRGRRRRASGGMADVDARFRPSRFSASASPFSPWCARLPLSQLDTTFKCSRQPYTSLRSRARPTGMTQSAASSVVLSTGTQGAHRPTPGVRRLSSTRPKRCVRPLRFCASQDSHAASCASSGCPTATPQPSTLAPASSRPSLYSPVLVPLSHSRGPWTSPASRPPRSCAGTRRGRSR
jgi:hypothetical protein